MTKNLSKDIYENYLLKLEAYGEQELYIKIVKDALLTLDQDNSPEIFILECSDACFIMFRRTGDVRFFILGKVFRRAAHALYRKLIKINKTKI